TVGEEEGIDVARRDLGELHAKPRAHLGGRGRPGVRERGCLLGDRADDALVAVTDVDAHQLAVEVDEALALGRPEVDSFRTGDGYRVHGRLRRPLVDRVAPTELDHLFAGEGGCHGHESSVLHVGDFSISSFQVPRSGSRVRIPSLARYAARNVNFAPVVVRITG